MEKAGRRTAGDWQPAQEPRTTANAIYRAHSLSFLSLRLCLSSTLADGRWREAGVGVEVGVGVGCNVRS